MTPPLCNVNRFMRMERYIFIRYHQRRDEPHTCALLGPSRWRASPRIPPRPARTALAYVGALLACATSTAAQQRWHWPGAAGTTSPGATTSQIAPVPADSGPSLQLEWQAPTYLAWGVNPLAGPELDVVPGDPQAHPQPVHYQLPFRDVPVQVDQGLGGHFSHTDRPNWYAVDFAMRQGTPVLAARP